MRKFIKYLQDISFIVLIVCNIVVIPVACIVPSLGWKNRLNKVTKEYEDKLASVKKELHRSEDYLFSLIKLYAIDKPKEVKELSTKIANNDISQHASKEANIRRVEELKEMQKLLQDELNLFRAYGYE